MSKLFTPIEIKGVKFRNRIVMSPMCQYSANEGYANHWHLVHYTTRAIGGVGAIIVEATAVSPEGRISLKDLGIYSDKHIEKLHEIVACVEEYGAVPGIQLAHAGRKAGVEVFLQPESEGEERPVAPSELRFSNRDPLPRSLNKKDIEKVKQDFKSASIRAIKAGFKVIEIHAAHGYLLHEFLSPLSNKRSDEYGGSFENRIRLLLEVVEGVNQAIEGRLPLFVRISATDWVKEGGWDLEQSIALVKILENKGVDVIDVSTGAIVPDVMIPSGPGYQLPFASSIKKSVEKILVGTVGLYTTALQGETILRNQDADFIFYGRELLRNPYFSLQAAQELNEEVEWPQQYTRSKTRHFRK
ncbi:oxidoreductase [Elizabethkingia argentiflava]|uniref:Oxidoreductase n=1 Tax=Elizabethkingia argenteiflava TaxID=2681556 RepID=A0A845PWU5_9FLAO|nr:NADH:flavin oxidoreductase/NADH oxidase [Elizabethkingia argenteiflava]NAW52105.1 oxidoreductase [Elizabethkingia argenteiflava]